MSTVSVTNIKNAASASNNLVLDSSGNTAAAGTVAMGSSYLRNRIINGDMRIDQRNAGAAVTINAASRIYTVDRFFGYGQSADGVFTVQRDTSAPANFTNSAKITVTTADASVGATQLYVFSQSIEGFNTADFSWGTSSAIAVTLSFWVRSSVTGTFGGAIGDNGATRSYPFSYTINAANTWEYKTVAIPAITSGNWPTDNTASVQIFWDLGSGSTYQGLSGAWASAAYYGASSTTRLISTLNATWQITGVQLEVGTVATPFERRLYGTELMLCQRYLPAWNWSGSGNDVIGTGYSTDTVNSQIFVPFPVTPRVRPTGVTSSGLANIVLRNGSNVGGAPTAINVGVMGSFNGSQITVTTTAGSPTLVAGQGAFLFANGAAQILFTGCEL